MILVTVVVIVVNVVDSLPSLDQLRKSSKLQQEVDAQLEDLSHFKGHGKTKCRSGSEVEVMVSQSVEGYTNTFWQEQTKSAYLGCWTIL